MTVPQHYRYKRRPARRKRTPAKRKRWPPDWLLASLGAR